MKVARLRGFGTEVRLAGEEYAEALSACEEFAALVVDHMLEG